MTEEADRRRRFRKRLWLGITLVIALLAVLLVPPMVSLQRYKSRITQLVSASLGRPVHLSSVKLRLLPLPGFVLSDLTVEDDPAYGAEPVLHANSVAVAIRLTSLWRGRLAIRRISVDEASLNVVRSPDGRWNLDPLFRTAATHSKNAGQGGLPPLPYLEASESRINIKNGLEKLPYSLVNADVSFWQENPGEWRLRLRGQPSRTDVNLDLADTGIVRVEASLRNAPALRDMPLHVELEWREAQLGQLSRLILGSDPGWRGDLTGALQLDGTAETAQVKARLSASGVHRAEFAPADALDFDANCTFVYHYSQRAVENMACDSPLGGGHIKLAGNWPGSGPSSLSLAADRIPVSAGLGVLRTLRSGISDDLDVGGTVSGELHYDPSAPPPAARPAETARTHETHSAAKNHAAPPPLLTGNLTVNGFRLSGNGLRQPLQIAKFTLEPAPPEPGQPQQLATTIPVPAGGPSPLNVDARLGAHGYRVAVRGSAALPRLRELAHVVGVTDTSSLDTVAGEPVTLDIAAEGRWLPSVAPLNSIERAGSVASLDQALVLGDADTDQLSGIITVHNANWKPEALAHAVILSDAVLHLGNGSIVWDPVSFAYGPIKGTASLQVATTCPESAECLPQLDLRFDSLDAATLESALLGARQKSTMLSELIARFTPETAHTWPRVNGTLKAGTLTLGPVALKDAAILFRVKPEGAEFSSIDATLLDGRLHATGSISGGDKPAYAFDGKFEKVGGAAVCKLVALRCAGGALDGSGKIALSGFAASDLSASATGTLHYDWRRGGLKSPDAPRLLARFDRWTGDAAIEHGAITLTQNAVQQGSRKASAAMAIHFGDPPKTTFDSAQPGDTAQR